MASTPDNPEILGESLAEYDFGGLTTLINSGNDVLDKILKPDHWTISTKSEGEEDRAVRFSMHLKKFKKALSLQIREEVKTIAKIETQMSLVEINKSEL